MNKKDDKPKMPEIEFIDDSIYTPKKNIGSPKTDKQVVDEFLKSVKNEIKKGLKG
jgi:hypothetical protein